MNVSIGSSLEQIRTGSAPRAWNISLSWVRPTFRTALIDVAIPSQVGFKSFNNGSK